MIPVLIAVAVAIIVPLLLLALVDAHLARHARRDGVGQFANRNVASDEQTWGDQPLVPHALQIRSHAVINSEVEG